MDFVYQLLVAAHLLGMAAVVGGWMAVRSGRTITTTLPGCTAGEKHLAPTVEPSVVAVAWPPPSWSSLWTTPCSMTLELCEQRC